MDVLSGHVIQEEFVLILDRQPGYECAVSPVPRARYQDVLWVGLVDSRLMLIINLIDDLVRVADDH
ncbi:hypothetical protein RSM1_09050 [Methylobacterium radiotolerans]|nr:hypothetical protein RSM1_09050 [Methylobacterium radiotolerans]